MKRLFSSIICCLLYADCIASEALKTSPTTASAGNILNVLLGLAVVLVVIYMLAFGIRKFGAVPGKSNHIIRVISGLNLSQRDKIVLIQVGEEQLLLGVSPGRICLLHNIHNIIDDEQNQKQAQESGFARKFAGVLRGEIK